jgi:hypothetical protein
MRLPEEVGRADGHIVCVPTVSVTQFHVTESTNTNNNNNSVQFFIYLRSYSTAQSPVIK